MKNYTIEIYIRKYILRVIKNCTYEHVHAFSFLKYLIYEYFNKFNYLIYPSY